MIQKKRLVQSADTTFNSEVKYDDKNQRWVAQRTLTEEESFLTEDQAKDWIQKGQRNKPEAIVSNPNASEDEKLPDPAKQIQKQLPPPPEIGVREQNNLQYSIGLPVDGTHKVKLPVAHLNKKRLIAKEKMFDCHMCNKKAPLVTYHTDKTKKENKICQQCYTKLHKKLDKKD